MTLKYQGSFVRFARECSVADGNMIAKIGVEGRIVLGPAGSPGRADIPLRFAVVHETPTGMQRDRDQIRRGPGRSRQHRQHAVRLCGGRADLPDPDTRPQRSMNISSMSASIRSRRKRDQNRRQRHRRRTSRTASGSRKPNRTPTRIKRFTPETRLTDASGSQPQPAQRFMFDGRTAFVRIAARMNARLRRGCRMLQLAAAAPNNESALNRASFV